MKKTRFRCYKYKKDETNLELIKPTAFVKTNREFTMFAQRYQSEFLTITLWGCVEFYLFPIKSC